MVNVLRCTQVFFTQSLLRPDVKHNARTSNVKMLKTFLILAPIHVPFRAEREQLHKQCTGRFDVGYHVEETLGAPEQSQNV
jgi:hypothetical protein